MTDNRPVTQEDREAAFAYMAEVAAMQGKYDDVLLAFTDEICDDLPIVQALARHRTDAQAELLDALRALLARIDHHFRPHSEEHDWQEQAVARTLLAKYRAPNLDRGVGR